MSIKSYRFPITAISSILHRVSGVILLLGMPIAVVMMYFALGGEEGYTSVVNCITSSWFSLFFCLFLSAITYHVYAGVRHMIMDMGFAESMKTASTTSIVVIVLGVVSTIFWGAVLWL